MAGPPGGGLVLAGLVAIASPAGVFAQRPTDTFLQQQRMIEEEAREALDRELPAEQKIDFDWGGWYSFNLFLFDDGIESSRTFRQHDVRLWGALSLDQGAHQLYARTKLQFEDFNHGDGFDDEDDVVGPNLDRGFYQFDLQRAARAYFNENLDWNLKLKLGRDLVEFGTGYALSLPMDHVLVTGEFGDIEVQGLAGTTVRSMDDIDLSRPNYYNSERNFWGVQLSYTGIENHKPFVYAVWNEDQRTETPTNPFQNFDYDTYYIGFGSTGEIVKNLRYGTEWVFENGNSYGDRQFIQRDDVEAWAFDAGLEYLSQRPMKPRIHGEYMFASGDPDRRFSPTNAIGGNTRGDDNSFVGFGYRDTGLSFAPRLSNVHVWRAGGSFLPFEDNETLKGIELGTDWFLYWKNHGDGAVSDGTADRQSGYLGWEMDYFVNWRITSDLAWTARLGTFFPGSAFSDQTTRTFFLVGMTWSF